MVPSVSTEPVTARPSFAKVAASAASIATPRVAKDSTPKIKPSVATPRSLDIPPFKRPVPVTDEAVVVSSDVPTSKRADDKAGSASARTGEWIDSALQSAAPPSDIKEGISSARPQSIALSKLVAEDSSTQVSSSSGSVKLPSDNGKSTYSLNTLSIDEQESIRPDDSASLRAVEEEEMASPPGSLPAGSRQGSDHGAGAFIGANAFQDQFQHISAMNPHPHAHRGVPNGRAPNQLPSPYQHMFDPNNLVSGSGIAAQPASLVMPKIEGYDGSLTVADQPLITALQTPRDRLFVVRLEELLAGFINESTERELVVEDNNAFYRLCTHRLANYYCLSSAAGPTSQTNIPSVKVIRTPFARIPPLVSRMVDIGKDSTTPPVVAPARKILRRDDGKSGTNTAANSQTPSKTTSEDGGSEGSSDAQDAKEKGPLSRDEREARYNARRAELFSDIESEQNDGGGPSEEKDKDVSRSSSAAGKKKNKGKQRNYDDDEFHSRSAFSVYYSPGPSGYSQEHSAYYTAMSGGMSNAYSSGPYSSMASGPTPPQPGSTTYSSMYPPQAQPQHFPGQQFHVNGAQPNGPGPMYPNYGQMPNQYDLSADFQRGMSSFQNAGMPSQVTPRMGPVPMASFPGSQQNSPPMHAAPGWPPMQQPYPMPQGAFQQPGPGNRPMSAPHQGPVPGTYPYGQFPPNPMNGRPNMNQHPIPGSYNRQQFNPQSQAFIPGVRGPPYMHHVGAGHQGLGQHAGHGGGGNTSMGNMMGNMGMHGAGPYSVVVNNNIPGNAPGPLMPALPVPQPGLYAPSSPPYIPTTNNNYASPMHRNASQPGGELSSAQSSIAKYGTPAHLPAKPPAPAPVQTGGPKLGGGSAPVVVSSSPSTN
ncbi:hypothetical protein DE146DRAFT_162185 [Phaeosphaeria sp. MPI-PUGE-AT-0046c]|nr:hypothetical protein DE146DRAFT_162185 [Phaeosphaeria sp. MPI-PUGE-AT-0046c]